MLDRAIAFQREDGVRGHVVENGGRPEVFVELGREFTFHPEVEAAVIGGLCTTDGRWSKILEEAERRIALSGNVTGQRRGKKQKCMNKNLI